jgi:hypothetical protein
VLFTHFFTKQDDELRRQKEEEEAREHEEYLKLKCQFEVTEEGLGQEEGDSDVRILFNLMYKVLYLFYICKKLYNFL